MTRKVMYGSSEAFAMQTLARHQAINRLLAEVLFDMTVCRCEGWDPYEFIEIIWRVLESIKKEAES